MNKIYKVVWSKAKHCYVVTSELAKRQTKGCGARSLRMATVSLGLAAALIGGVFAPVAEATYVKVGDKYYAYSGGNWGSYYNVDNLYWNPSGKSLTVSAATMDDIGNVMTVDSTSVTGSDAISTKKGGRYVFGNVAYGSADGTRVIVNRTDSGKGGKVTIDGKENQIYLNPGSAGYYGAHGTVSGYTVTVDMGSSGSVTSVFGGISSDSDVTGNNVELKSGTVKNAITGGQNTYGGTGSANNNTVTISGGTVNQYVYGGNSYTGNANENTVTINGGTVKYVYGGEGIAYANGNRVTVTAGTVNYVVGAFGTAANDNVVTVSGGTVDNSGVAGGGGGWNFEEGVVKTAKNNTVSIEGNAQINGMVSGGRDAYGTVVVSDNTVTIKENAVVTGDVYGGFGWGDGNGDGKDDGLKTKNTVNIEGNAQVTGNVSGGYQRGYYDYGYTGNTTDNTVNIDISGNALTGNVYGGAVTGYIDGDATGNKVNIKAGTVGGNVYGGTREVGEVNTGNSNNRDVSVLTGNAKDNTVTVSNGKVTGNVYGGWVESKLKGNATGNKVEISGGTVTGNVYGGNGSNINSAPGSANENTITVSKGSVNGDVVGGMAGNTSKNMVTVSGGEVGRVSGAISSGYGESLTSSNNQVIIKDTAKVNGDVYGTKDDTSGYGTAASSENTVTIDGNAVVTGCVYGADGRVKDKISNKVYIKNGTVEGGVYGGNCEHASWGGDATGSADGNLVEISGGTVNGSIYGGVGVTSASGNTVTIKDNAEIGEDVSIYGGQALHSSTTYQMIDGTLKKVTELILGTVSNNTVNIEKAITVKGLSGGFGDETKSAGNTLNIGATGVQATIGVNYFHTIALTDAVPWENGKTVLSAKNFDYDDSIKAALDISAATNLASATSGQMTLLASQTDNDLNTLSLIYYDDGTATLDATTPSVKVKEAASSDDDGSGVIVNAQSTHTVSLDADNNFKNVFYKAESGSVTGVTFNADTPITFNKTGAARDLTGKTFATTNTVDADNLKFAETNDPLKTNDSMTLVANATGITTDVANGTGKTVAINYKDDKGIVFVAEASGNVTAADSTVKYTVGSVTVSSVDLSGWNRSDTSAVITDWTGSNVAVETGNFAAPEMTGPTLDIVTASEGFFGTVNGNNAYGNGDPLENDTENGITVTGYKVGGVKAENNGAKLTYYAMKKTADKLALEGIAFADGQTARTFTSEYDLANAIITASDTSAALFTNVSAMKGGQSMTLVDASGAGTTTIAAFADKKYETVFDDKVTDNLNIKGTQTDWLKQDSGTKLVYTVGDRVVSEATMSGDLAWLDDSNHYKNEAYKFDSNSKVNVGVNFTSTTDPLAGATKRMTLIQNAAGVTTGNVTGTPTFAVTLDKTNTTLSANASGTVVLNGNDVMYSVSSVALQTVAVKGVGNTADEVPANWELASGATVETDNMAEPDLAVGTEKKIINGTAGFFANAAVNGAYAYGAKAFESVSGNGVTLSGTQNKGVDKSADNASIVYKVGTKDVKTVDIGTVEWGGEALDGSSADYNYAGAAFGTDNFVISNPDQVEVDTSMTLLKANETLAEMAEETKKASYAYSPVSGVRIDGDITGTMSRSGNNIMFAAMENKASQLTFTDVEWKDTLMTRPANIVFDGAKVVTTDIKFTNIDSQVADQTMTLVKNFDGTPSAIEGDHYMVGSGRMGEGAAEMSGNDLIFRAKTGTAPTEATHETVMAMEAGTAVVAAGREYVDSAVEGLGLVSNMAPDGTSTFASMGGGVGRYKTGSHVDTHTWSAVVAVGSKREHKKGNLEWGVFAEYGRGNYTLHDDNGGRGDGDTNYAGGGLLAKWTNKHDVYTEASVRMGRMSDSASNMLMDRLGNSYGYDIHANYFGAHVGLGKIIKVKKNRDLDVYGKYFYLRRNGVDFDAGGNHYSLDSVTSSLLRVGARYGSNDKRWNWYGGLAYEYEFGGESKGTVDGLAIRSASIKGGSVRGEIGMRMEATKTNPWKVDIGIYGYGGKHRGFGGNVSVAYMF